MKNWNKIIAQTSSSILEVMTKINDSASKFAMILDDKNKLLGTVSDGDIRRGLLKGIQLSESVDKVMNRSPRSVKRGTSKDQIMQLMRELKITHIPVLDDSGVVVDVETLDEMLSVQPKENHVILMAGGLGSRLGHLTQDVPKPMLKVGNKPILETIISNFRCYGFKNFHLSVNYKSNIIEDYFKDGKDFGVHISYIKETKKLGTAGSLSLYMESNNLPFIVMNGDLLTKINFDSLLKEHTARGNLATMCVRQYEYQVPYGVIMSDGEKMTGIEEKPLQSFFVNGGIYVFEPSVLKEIPKDIYLDMPTLFQSLMAKDCKVGIYPIHEYWLDIGRKDDFIKAHDEYEDIFK